MIRLSIDLNESPTKGIPWQYAKDWQLVLVAKMLSGNRLTISAICSLAHLNGENISAEDVRNCLDQFVKDGSIEEVHSGRSKDHGPPEYRFKKGIRLNLSIGSL